MTKTDDAIAKRKRRWEHAELALEIASLLGGALVIGGLYIEGLPALGSELVIAGVVIEVAFGWCVLVVSRKLQAILETEIARLKNETAQLNADSLALMQASRNRGLMILGDQDSPFWELRKFAGTELFIQSSAPEEPTTFAKSLGGFDQLGFVIKWTDESQTHTANPDGATLWTWLPLGMTPKNDSAPRPLAHEPETPVETAYVAAEALTSYLRLTGIDCRHFAGPHVGPDGPPSIIQFSALPEGAILVTIGRRPEPIALTLKFVRELLERLGKDTSAIPVRYLNEKGYLHADQIRAENPSFLMFQA
jgi:hypothetical protein